MQFGRNAATTNLPVKEESTQETAPASDDTSSEKPESVKIPAPSEEDEESYFTKPEEETYYGISKSELDELNEIVDEEIAKEEAEKENPAPAEEASLDDSDDEFQDVLNKRAEGKNDEVE